MAAGVCAPVGGKLNPCCGHRRRHRGSFGRVQASDGSGWDFAEDDAGSGGVIMHDFMDRATNEKQVAATKKEDKKEGMIRDQSALGVPEEMAEIGYVIDAHGLNGEIRVRPLTDEPEDRFNTPGVRWLRKPGTVAVPLTEPYPVRVISGRQTTTRGAQDWLVQLEGVPDRDTAVALKGSTLFIDTKDRPPLRTGEGDGGEDEYYVQELVGLQAFRANSEGEEALGTVEDVIVNGGADVLLLQESGSGKQVYVPFVSVIVPRVDLSAGVLEIDPPEGLFELNDRHDDGRKGHRPQKRLLKHKKPRGRSGDPHARPQRQ